MKAHHTTFVSEYTWFKTFKDRLTIGNYYINHFTFFCTPCKNTDRKKIIGSKIDPCGGRLTISQDYQQRAYPYLQLLSPKPPWRRKVIMSHLSTFCILLLEKRQFLKVKILKLVKLSVYSVRRFLVYYFRMEHVLQSVCIQTVWCQYCIYHLAASNGWFKTEQLFEC